MAEAGMQDLPRDAGAQREELTAYLTRTLDAIPRLARMSL